MGRARVLLVEDDVYVAKGWARRLRRSGFDVWCAHSVSEAETLVMHVDCDVVFIDLCLPDGDGSELLSILEQLTNPPAVCVVSGAIDAKRAIEIGGRANLVIPKPVTGSALADVAERMLLKTIPSGWVAKFCRVHRLSPTESAVLMAAAKRIHDKEIADALGCSYSTVRTHWGGIFDKTGFRPKGAVLCALLSFAKECV